MPIYTYECQKCGKVWEALQRADTNMAPCIGCGKDAARIPSRPGQACFTGPAFSASSGPKGEES